MFYPKKARRALNWSQLLSWPHCYKYRLQPLNKSFGKDAIDLEIEQIKKDIILAEAFLASREEEVTKNGEGGE